MLIIPTQAVPNQTFSVTLNNQYCTVHVYAKSTGVYIDLSVNNALVIAGIICLNATLIVRDAYFGFSGDLVFVDLQGTDDPTYTGFGSRWILVYLAPSDLAAGQA
jgi:fumarate reductase subunit C